MHQPPTRTIVAPFPSIIRKPPCPQFLPCTIGTCLPIPLTTAPSNPTITIRSVFFLRLRKKNNKALVSTQAAATNSRNRKMHPPTDTNNRSSLPCGSAAHYHINISIAENVIAMISSELEDLNSFTNAGGSETAIQALRRRISQLTTLRTRWTMYLSHLRSLQAEGVPWRARNSPMPPFPDNEDGSSDEEFWSDQSD